MSFSRGSNPIWFFNNLVGQPVDDTYYAFFNQNVVPYNPQTVYQDPYGNVAWSNPIEFRANAGLPDNIYFSDQVYQIQVRQGPNDTDPLIYEVNNYTANSGGSSGLLANPLTVAENMITNPQFADMFIPSPTTFTTAGTYPIAPGWSLVLSGTGSVTVSQVTNDGNSGLIGSPAYALSVTNGSSFSSVQLVQTLSNNGSIFNLGAIAIAFSAYVTPNVQNMVVSYEPSTGAGTQINNFSIQTSSFGQYAYAVNTNPPDNTNTDVGSAAYVNIIFQLPNTGNIIISNIQFVGQSNELQAPLTSSPSSAPAYAELSYNRMVDHEFNVYRNALVNEQKQNILTGWTFNQNPYQFWPTAQTNVPANQYTLDQTVVIQQAYVAGGAGNNVSVGANASGNGEMNVQAVTNNSQFAILQYIDPKTLRPAFGSKVSLRVRALLTTTNATTCKFKVRLIYNTGTVQTLARNEPVLTWAANGEPAYTVGANGWTAIAPPNDPVYTLSGSFQSFDFNGIQLPANPGVNTTFAVVIYTMGALSSAGTPDVVTFDRVSLVKNDFAIEPHSETFDEALRKCQFYYEKSYQVGTPVVASIGIVTAVGQVTQLIPLIANGANWTLRRQPFGLTYENTKRTIPTVVFYSPASTAAGNIQMSLNTGVTPTGAGSPVNVVATDWTVTGASVDRLDMVNNNTNEVSSLAIDLQSTGVMNFHYTADCRIGIV